MGYQLIETGRLSGLCGFDGTDWEPIKALGDGRLIAIPGLKCVGISRGAASVPSGTETTIFSYSGMGELVWLRVSSTRDAVEVRVYADGTRVWADEFLMMYNEGCTASTPLRTLSKYTAGGSCVAVWELHIFFTSSLEIRVMQNTGVTVTVERSGVLNAYV